ncbi:MAG: hypothetical protein ACN4GM_04955 [Gammaproteobacteria bacterium]
MKSKIYIFNTLFCFFLAMYSLQASSGELGDFQEDIAKNKKENNARYNNCIHCKPYNDSESFFEILFGDLVEAIANETAEVISEGGRASNQRVSSKPHDPDINKRQPGEILIPFYRFNINTQHVSDQINAIDLKMEIGKGAIGFEFRATKYTDDITNDELKYNQVQYFHRMSFGNKIGLNLGIGYGQMNGVDSFDGLVLSAPILFHNGHHLGFEIRPSVFNADGVSINDLDLSALYTYRKLAFRIGHRSLESPNVDIDGYYIGFDFIF